MLNPKLRSPKLWAQVATVFLLITFIAIDIRHYIDDSSTPELTSSTPEPTSSPPERQLTWTRKAAIEAEDVAAIDCSNHGRAYVDGNIVNGQQVCECHNCYSGEKCEKFEGEECVADAVVGDALFLRKYWMDIEKGNIATVISGWHRMSYFIGTDYMSEELDKHIRLLHEAVGNANVKGKYIVYGYGITQLLNGLILSLSPNMTDNPKATPKKVVALAPYYPVFRTQTLFFNHSSYQWKGDALTYKDHPNGQDFIEIVTSPNNPDGFLHNKTVIKNSIAIYDHATYWPHYAPIEYESDEDIMLFTLSKYTGHGGSRFGWAILKDESLYTKLTAYVRANSVGVSRETQFRALKLLKDTLVQIEKKKVLKNDFNEFGYDILRNRWVEFTKLLNSSTTGRFSFQKMEDRYCNYFKRSRKACTAYVWLKCNWPKEDNCAAVLEAGKIKAYSGVDFEADNRYARLSLIQTTDDFNQLTYRFKFLAEETEGSVDMSLYNSIVNRERSSGRPFILDADH